MECFGDFLKCNVCCQRGIGREEDSDVYLKKHFKRRNVHSKVSRRGYSKWRNVTSWFHNLRSTFATESRLDGKSTSNLTLAQTQTSNANTLDWEDDDATKYTPILLSAFYDCYSWSQPFPRQNPTLTNDVFFSILCDKKHFILPKFYPKSLVHIIDNSSSHCQKISKRRSHSDPQLCTRSNIVKDCDKKNLSELRDFHYKYNKASRKGCSYIDTASGSHLTLSPKIGIKQKVCDKVYSIWDASKTFTNLLPNQTPDSRILNINETIGLEYNSPPSIAHVKDNTPGNSQLSSLIQSGSICEKNVLKNEFFSELEKDKLFPSCDSDDESINQLCDNLPNEVSGSGSLTYFLQTDVHTNEPNENALVYQIYSSDLIFPNKILESVDETIQCRPIRDQAIDVISNTSSNASHRGKEVAAATWKQVRETVVNLKSKIQEKYHSTKNCDIEPDANSWMLKKDNVNPNFKGSQNVYSLNVSCNKDGKQNSIMTNKVSLSPFQPVTVESSSTLYTDSQKMPKRTSDIVKNDSFIEPLFKHRSICSKDGNSSQDDSPIRPERGKRSKIFKKLSADEQDKFKFPSGLPGQTYNKSKSYDDSIEASRRAFTYNMIYTDPTDLEVTNNKTTELTNENYSAEMFIYPQNKPEVSTYDPNYGLSSCANNFKETNVPTDLEVTNNKTTELTNENYSAEMFIYPQNKPEVSTYDPNHSLPSCANNFKETNVNLLKTEFIYENKNSKIPSRSKEVPVPNKNKNRVNLKTDPFHSRRLFLDEDGIESLVRTKDICVADEKIPNEYAYVLNKPKDETSISQTQFTDLVDKELIVMENMSVCKSNNNIDLVKNKQEKRSVDITLESEKDLLIFTSKLDITIFKDVPDNSCESDHYSSEDINNDSICKDNHYSANENKAAIGKELYSCSGLCHSSPVTSEEICHEECTDLESEASKINLHVAPSVDTEKIVTLDNVVNYDNAPCTHTIESLSSPSHALIKSDSQPQIFITPAECSDSQKLKREQSISSNEGTDFFRGYGSDNAVSVVFAAASSLESHHDCSSILSEMDTLFPYSKEGTSSLAPSNIHRPTTPKSPVTVQEWVDSLPITTENSFDEQDSLDSRDDELSFLIEENQSGFLSKRRSTKESIIEETLLLGDEAAALATPPHSMAVLREGIQASFLPLVPTVELRKPPPPLTLKDIQSAMSKADPAFGKGWHAEAPGRRSQFSDSRDKQTSFQSEASNISFLSHQTTVSSIESLLESRQADPVDILLNLGFGGCDEDEGLSRIPARFLKPSKVPGNDINTFIKQEDNISDLVDSSDWVVPGISAQALRKSSVAVVSPLVTKLLESVRRSQGFIQDVYKKPLKKFASVAKGLGKQAVVTNKFSQKVSSNSCPFSTIYTWSEGGRAGVSLPQKGPFLDRRDQLDSKQKTILGSGSLATGRNDEFIYRDVDSNGSVLDSNKESIMRKTSVKPDKKHRDSVISIISSTTSIDSQEEELRDARRQLRLSLIRKPQPSSYHPEFGRMSHRTRRSSPSKKTSYWKRIPASFKRKAFASQSSTSSWEIDHQIAEEEVTNSLQSQIIAENLSTEDYNAIKNSHKLDSDVSSDLESNVFECCSSEKASGPKKYSNVFQFPPPNSLEVVDQPSSTASRNSSTFKGSSTDSLDEDGSEHESLCSEFAKTNKKSVIKKGSSSEDPNLVEMHIEDRKESPVEGSRTIRGVTPRNFKNSGDRLTIKNSNSRYHIKNQLSHLKHSNGNWSMESSKSFETVKHYPLIRNCAVYSDSPCSDLITPCSDLNVPPIIATADEAHRSDPTSDFCMKRTNSLPTILVEDKVTAPKNEDLTASSGFEDGARSYDSDECIKSTINILQNNFNTAMLAVLQTCKTQSSLQEMLSNYSSSRSLNSPSKTSLKERECSHMESKGSNARGSLETIEIASQMKASINSVVSHLERYYANVCPSLSEFQPDITNTISQMLLLSHHQSQLCSELERMSSPDMTASGTQSPTPSRPSPMQWAVSHPNFYRSMPDQLNCGGGIATPPSIHSVSPFYNSPIAPFVHSTPLTRFSATTTPLSGTRLSSPPNLRRQMRPSLSESSYEESVELAESSLASECIDGKRPDSSPVYTSQWPCHVPSETLIGNLVREKVSQEIEENLGEKVTEMTTHLGELRDKMDQNFQDVAEIRDKLNFIVKHISSSGQK